MRAIPRSLLVVTLAVEHRLWHFGFIRDSAIHDGAVYYVTYDERDSTTAMEPNPPRRDDP